MTKDEIIEMVMQIGGCDRPEDDSPALRMFVTFAKLVAEKEREACAEIAEKQRYAMNISLTSHPVQNGTAVGIANQIRARGQE